MPSSRRCPPPLTRHEPPGLFTTLVQGITPGTNKKRHLSGSIPWRTGQVFVTEAAPKQGRNGALILKHLDELRRRLRRYRKIHVICANTSGHTSLEVIQYLWEWEGRIEVNRLPSYSPDLNPIERVW